MIPPGRIIQEAAAPPQADTHPLGVKDGLSGLLVAGGMVVIVFMLLRGQRAKFRTAADRLERPTPRISGDPATARLESAMADAAELARHLAAALDNRAARVELLIEEADARLAQLRALGKTDEAGALRDEVRALAEEGRTAVEIAQRLRVPPGEVELMLRLGRG